MKTTIFLGTLLLLVPSIGKTQGSIYKFGTTIRVNKGDTLSKNVIAAGRFVDVFGHLEDDLFSAADNIIVGGSVNDDALIAGRMVTVRGKIGDMLVTAGETVIIDGEVDGDLFAAANEVRLAPNAHIRGNVAVAGGHIMFEGGQIEGWLRASGNEMTVNGQIGNTVELYGNKFRFGEGYNSSSGTIIHTTRELTKDDIANAPNDLRIVIEKEEIWGAALVFSLWFYIAMLILGIVFILVFPETTVDLYRYGTERYLRNTGAGLLLFLGIPLSVLVLLVLIFTIPLSIILLICYGLALTIAFLMVAITLGTLTIRLIKTEEFFSDYFWGFALGMVLILILSALPFVGGIINILLIFFGLGTLLSYLWKVRYNSI